MEIRQFGTQRQLRAQRALIGAAAVVLAFGVPFILGLAGWNVGVFGGIWGAVVCTLAALACFPAARSEASSVVQKKGRRWKS